jgi:hypothetical protein
MSVAECKDIDMFIYSIGAKFITQDVTLIADFIESIDKQSGARTFV